MKPINIKWFSVNNVMYIKVISANTYIPKKWYVKKCRDYDSSSY